MHFDDRLATVLRLPASGEAMARIQFRQLVDLLGRGAGNAPSSPTVAAAFARLEELEGAIPAKERALILREPSNRLTNAAFVARLASAEPDIASAAIAAAALDEQQWLALIPALPVHARGILRHRGRVSPRVDALLEQLGVGDRALPAPADSERERPSRPELIVLEGGASLTGRGAPRVELRKQAPAVVPSDPEPVALQGDDDDAGIGAIVRRIEAFRKARTDSPEPEKNAPGARAAPTAAVALDFATDAVGRIDWVDGPLGPSLVGAMLEGADASASARLQSALRHRQPLTDVMIVLAGAPALAGTWRLDAVPRFAGPSGSFTGYAGRLRRPSPSPSRALDPTDSMRQILHELRTPANAMQVAAEIIQQQLYGPAPHEYRALAAAIAGDTAQILAGFEELDRLVKLETGALTFGAGECEVVDLVLETVARLRAWTGPRGSGFAMHDPGRPVLAAMEQDEAARLLWRILATLAGATIPGETLMLSFTELDDQVELAVDLPESLASRMDEVIASGQPLEPVRALSAGMFGIGFTLRLAEAEANAVGGSLERDGTRFRLSLPRLTPSAASHTHA